jgi:mono/diheme cytochrome c family protein
MKKLKFIALFTAFALFAIACNQTATTDSTTNTTVAANSNAVANNQTAAPVDELAAAKKHYSEMCVACHKENGTGGKVEIEGKKMDADDLTSAKLKKMDDAKYFRVIKEGIIDEGMPAYKDKLSDDEIRDVVKFIRRDFQKN